MRKHLALISLVVFTLAAPVAVAQLYPGFADGGSLIAGSTLADGGLVTSATLDTGHVTNWNPTLRCSSFRGSPGVYYRWSGDAGTATNVDPLLEVNTARAVPIIQIATPSRDERRRWISILSEDGGVPSCSVWADTIP